jgi:hypothetical protein
MRIQILARLAIVGMIGGTIIAGAAVPAGAQSLAEVARKEEARRKNTRPSGKTYTNNDLPAAAASAPAGASGSTPSEPAVASPAADPVPATAEPDKPAPTDKAAVKDQAYWSQRMRELRQSLERDLSYAEAMQTRINVLTTDFTNRDDPAQRARIGVDRQKAVNELGRLTKTIEDDNKAIADLEEEARRAGVPAGWLR